MKMKKVLCLYRVSTLGQVDPKDDIPMQRRECEEFIARHSDWVYYGERLEKACKILTELKTPFVINQNCYSIFERAVENNGLKETSHRLGKGIIAFSPLAQGLLTDRYLKGIPADSRIATNGFLKESALTEKRLEQISALNDLAKQRGQSLAQMALSWVLRDGIVTSVLVGASRPEQLLDNIKCIENTSFTQEELDLIDKISL